MFIKEEDFQAFFRGNEKAFEIIFHQYCKTLVSFAMRHGLEQMQAEDVVIEVFHRVWLLRGSMKSAAALHSLLFMAVRNRSLNIVRDMRKHVKVGVERISYAESSKDELLMEEEMSRVLEEGISRLPGQCRKVVLGMLAGKSLQEIAVEMDIAVNTAKTYKLRAIQLLRNMMDESTFLFLLYLLG